MRNWTSVVLITVAMAACHPRYAPLDGGAGGPGGLDSIRARILACIAARDYDQARELIQATVSEANFVGPRYGNAVYQRILDTGMQIWVWVRDGTIREAGYNEVPRSAAELLR